MSGILRLESLTKGNTLKQGDKTPLKYRLFDADGEKLNIAGKSAKVRLVYPDFLTIGYEKDGLTVAQDDTVTFTIDSVIPPRMYHVEIIVDDKFIFPSRADETKFTIDNSSLGTEANIVEIVGVDAVVRKAVDLINDDPSLIIDEDKLVSDIIKNTGIGSIEEYYQQFNDVITELSEEKDYHSLPEIAAARGGHDTLGARLDETTAQLAQKVDEVTFDIATQTVIFYADENVVSAIDVTEASNASLVQDYIDNLVADGQIEGVSIADNSLTTPKYVKDSVTTEITDFIKTTNNLVGKNNLIAGTNLFTGGSENRNVDIHTSRYIDIKQYSTFTFKHIFRIVYYDSQKNHIAGDEFGPDDTNVYTRSKPQNAGYMRVVIRGPYLDKAQINTGNTLRAFDTHSSSTLNELVEIGVNKVKPENVSFIQVNSSLAGEKSLVNGVEINLGDGLPYVDKAEWASTDFIEVDGEMNLTFKGVTRFALYDADKKFLSASSYTGSQTYTRSTTKEARFIRFTVHVSYANIFHVNKGYDLLPSQTKIEPHFESDLIKDRSIEADKLDVKLIKSLSSLKPRTKLPKPMLVISYDDNPSTDYNLAFPVHQQFGVPGEVGVITDFFTGRVANYRDFDYPPLTIEQLHEMQNAGWEVVTHTKSHLGLTENRLYSKTMKGENIWYVGNEGRWDISFPYEAVIYHRQTERNEEKLTITGKGVDANGYRYLVSEETAKFNHDYLHDSVFRLSDERLYEEIVGSASELRNLGFDVNSLSYPYNQHCSKTREIVKDHLLSARSGGPGTGVGFYMDTTNGFLPTQALRSYSESTNWPHERIDLMLDEIKDNNALGIIFEHSWNSYFNAEGLAYILEQAEIKGIEVTTRTKALEHHSNRFEHGDPLRSQGWFLEPESTFVINAVGKEFDDISKLSKDFYR